MEKPIALIFDLGNVLLPIDLDRTYQAFASLTSEYTAVEIKHITAEEGLWVAYEAGLETCEAFQQRLVQRFHLVCTQDEFQQAFNALLLPINRSTSDYLRQLSTRFPLYLLSNTSKIHSDIFLHEQYPNYQLFDVFNRLHLSFEMGVVKPDQAIFKQVVEANQLNKHHILFFDDNEANVLAARQAGWESILIQPDIALVQIQQHIQQRC